MKSQKNALPEPSLLTIKHVCARVSFCPAWVFKMVQDGRFPKPIKIGSTSRWLASSVDQWIDQQAEVSL